MTKGAPTTISNQLGAVTTKHIQATTANIATGVNAVLGDTEDARNSLGVEASPPAAAGAKSNLIQQRDLGPTHRTQGTKSVVAAKSAGLPTEKSKSKAQAAVRHFEVGHVLVHRPLESSPAKTSEAGSPLLRSKQRKQETEAK